MASHEFQNTLHRTAAEMCAAIAQEWLSAGGLNDASIQQDVIAKDTACDLADEVIKAWGLNRITNEDDVRYADATPITWLEGRDATRAMIVDAFKDLGAK